MGLLADVKISIAWQEFMQVVNQVQYISDDQKRYFELAAAALHEQKDKVEIPNHPLISLRPSHGAWVQAWVWVPNRRSLRDERDY